MVGRGWISVITRHLNPGRQIRHCLELSSAADRQGWSGYLLVSTRHAVPSKCVYDCLAVLYAYDIGNEERSGEGDV